MQVRTYDELPTELGADRHLVHLAAFGGVFSDAQIRTVRSSIDNLADYVGVFAVEGGRLVGQVFVLRIPYRFADGEGILTGIAGVGTRPDHARAGIARALLRAVHERERAAGIRYAALWTNRSWGAHALYEKLGYRDVYFPPWAVRLGHRPGRPPILPGLRVTQGRRRELEGIDRLHNGVLRARLGFVHRPVGFSSCEVRLGNLEPSKSLRVVRTGARIDGYAHVDSSASRVVCGELVARSAAARAALVARIEAEHPRAPVAFQNTVVTDGPSPLDGADYAVLTTSWYGLMGCELRGSWGTKAAVRRFATQDPRFVCMAGDRF